MKEFNLNLELSSYGPLIYDQYCGEPIVWGYRIRKYSSKRQLSFLAGFGNVRYVKWRGLVLMVKRLTKTEAILKYGPVTRREPKAIVFGSTKFVSKEIIME